MPARQRAATTPVLTLTQPQVPPSAITEIKRLGFSYTEVAQFDLGELSVDRRVQVREVGHYAPKDAVDRYAVQMSQSQFPPIVVTLDGWLIDGNTRVGAAEKRQQKFFPAIVIQIEYAGRTTTEKTQKELRALALTLNSNHGVPLTAKEARDGARDLISLSWRAEQIARALGLKPAVLTQVRREIAAEDKLRKVGFTAYTSLGGAALRALGSKDAQALNDAPFLGLALLAADAGLTATETTTAAKDVREIGSEEGQIQKLEALRTEFGDRIRERALTGKGKPAPSRQLRQHLGMVMKYEVATAHELLETDPAVNDTAMRFLDHCIPVLIALRNMQRPAGTPAKTDWTGESSR
jgi:ParB-like chromosome segregation protein Spo0J